MISPHREPNPNLGKAEAGISIQGGGAKMIGNRQSDLFEKGRANVHVHKHDEASTESHITENGRQNRGKRQIKIFQNKKSKEKQRQNTRRTGNKHPQLNTQVYS